jgi:hypothetical protein
MFGMGGRGPKQQPQRAAVGQPKAMRKPAKVTVTLQLDAGERAKLELLGGEAWIRRQIAASELPATSDR